MRRLRRLAIITTGCLAAALLSTAGVAGAATKTGPASFQLAEIHHVWIIELENTSFSTGFGHPSSDPELARVLVSKGALLRDYYGIRHDSLDNYIAEISGQACATWLRADRTPGTTRSSAPGTGVRKGCLYGLINARRRGAPGLAGPAARSPGRGRPAPRCPG
jgi:hypothetical protein